MAAETLAYQPVEQLEMNTQVTTETAINVGSTVFELLAEKFKTPDQPLANGTQTLSPTHSVTGYPPNVGVDRDSQPDFD